MPCLCAFGAHGQQLLSGSLTTEAGAATQAALCQAGGTYPGELAYAGSAIPAPVSATSGAPRIDQFRNGQLIATYTSFTNRPSCTEAGDGTDYLNPAGPAASGCGPFTRNNAWRLWAPGDVFQVYPAVYSGPYNQPFFGAAYDSPDDYSNNISYTPDNVVIQGLVKNNTRPVILLQGTTLDNTLGQAPLYFSSSTGLTIDSINVASVPGARTGKAGIYIDGANNLTLSNMRVTGFVHPGVNGIFATENTTGTLTLDGMELDHNGGPAGPAHNAYINASVDPNFTVVMTNSWTHDAYYGHLFKTRAQNGIFTGNLFQGRLPFGDRTQAETYALDVSNGGQISVRNNVFIKNRSGYNSNAMSLTFMLEGATDARPQSVDIENNTFVTFSRTYDGTHAMWPMAFLYPSIRPDSTAWPANIPTRIIKNAFVGYCTPNDGGVEDYRGDIDVIDGFSDLTSTYAFRTKIMSYDTDLQAIYPDYVAEIGTLAHAVQLATPGVRQKATVGAQD